jgi:hypothetical protein
MEHQIQKIQEAYEAIQRMEIWSDIEDEYTSDICYGWYDLEKACEEWYMDSCNLWENNYFQLLFDDSTPPYVENIVEEVKSQL